MELICNTTNGLEVDGMGFFLAGQLQDRMDTFSEKFEYPSAYNRRPPKFRRYASLLQQFNVIVAIHVQLHCLQGNAIFKVAL